MPKTPTPGQLAYAASLGAIPWITPTMPLPYDVLEPALRQAWEAAAQAAQAYLVTAMMGNARAVVQEEAPGVGPSAPPAPLRICEKEDTPHV